MSDINHVLIFNINFISTAILTVFALVGNSLVVFILSRPKFLKVSMFLYLLVSTIFDTINVLVSWPSVFPDSFQINQNSLSCKLFVYLFFVPFQTSPWIISISSVDRYLSIKYPKSLRFRNKFAFQSTSILIIFVAIILIDIPIFIYHDVSLNETRCVPTTFNIQFYLDILINLVSTIIPFCIMISTTLLTACNLKKQKSKLKCHSSKLGKELQLIKVLLAMDFYFLICNFPCNILTIVDDLLGINYFDTASFYILNAMSNVFFSCNFFIYFAFNKLFRHQFISLLKCNNQHNKVLPLVETTQESKTISRKSHRLLNSLIMNVNNYNV